MPEGLEQTRLRGRKKQRSPLVNWFRSSILVDQFFFGLLVALLTLIYSPVVLRPPYLPNVGEVAGYDIKADRDLLIEDSESTERRRNEAASAILPVYDWDAGMMDHIMTHIERSLTWMADTRRANPGISEEKLRDGLIQRLELDEPVPIPVFRILFDLDTPFEDQPIQPEIQTDDTEPSSNVVDSKRVVDDQTAATQPITTGSDLSASTPTTDITALAQPIATASPPQSYVDIVKELRSWLQPFAQQRIVSRREILRDLARSAYTVRKVEQQGVESRASGSAELMDIESFREVLKRTVGRLFLDHPGILRSWILKLVDDQIRPNLALNLTETKLRRQHASEAVEQAYFSIRKGEILLREGEVVKPVNRLKVERLYKSDSKSRNFIKLLGMAGVLGMIFVVGRGFLLRTAATFPRDKKTLYLLGTILLVVALVCISINAIGDGLADLFHWPDRMVAYLPPVALGSALASLMVGARTSIPGGSLVLGTTLSFLSTMAVNGGTSIFAYYLLGSLVGGAGLRTSRHRFGVLKSGLWIGIFQLAAFPVIELLMGYPPSIDWITGATMALSSGLLAGLFGLAIIPLMEWAFNITTDSRLLELASGDHPLLKELSLRAPGTYHHSVMMGNLAEAAAEKIGANPLMARVMALYHDIGKMTKPHYYVENQSGENRHDQLSPSMSVKVIQSHIKDGVELARKYNLSGPVLDAITEHQGTGQLRFFYNKALQESTKKGEEIREEEYRYPGPRPQSKESGILMVADSVEAAARTLKTPSPAQIQALVRRIINIKIEDRQLDECNLTLKDLSQIEEAFTRVLTLGFYHHRIAYPDQIRKRPT
ncbi:MAG: HDIG domain-containing protein [Magnetococcales bacterium]|nr:HDIG domain-containing protein [Magnetococcales bacterium]